MEMPLRRRFGRFRVSRRSWRSVITRRRAGTVGVLLVVTAALVVVLVPALAATVTPVKPPSGAGVTPQKVQVGAGGFSCSSVGSTGTGQFRISTPRTGTYPIAGTPYAIVLSNLSKSATISWTATGGLRVFDLGVAGEDGTAWYQYRPPVTPYAAPNQAYSNGTAASGRLSDTTVHGGANTHGGSGHEDADDLGAMTFCYSPDASVSGRVYRDRDENGSYSSGDTALQGWKVNAYSGSTSLGSATSAADGTYSLPTGTTTVKLCVVPPSGTWEQTEPTSGTSVACGGSGELGLGTSLAVQSAGSTVNFGNLPPKVSISGTVFRDDPPANGTQEVSESGINGWTVTLYTAGGSPAPISTTTTTSGGRDGVYTFNVRSLDTVTVCVKPTDSSLQTAPIAGGGCSAAGEFTNGQTIPVGSSNVTGKDFGARVPDAKVTGKTYIDRNSNGQLDATEATSGGWVVRAYLGSSTTPFTSTTSSSSGGTYQLSLPTTFTYTLCVVPPSGTWDQTVPAPGVAKLAADELANCRTVPGLSGDSQNNDFAGVQANTVASCSNPAGFANKYEFQVQCGKLSGTDFFTAYWTDGGVQKVLIHPVPDNRAGAANPLVEKITWNYPGDAQNLITIVYDDDPTGGYGDTTKVMKLCGKDPRTPGSEFGLGADTSGVLPTGETSCLLESRTLLDPNAPSGKRYVAYIYSEIDGFRSTT
jgi:hypothetical protein